MTVEQDQAITKSVETRAVITCPVCGKDQSKQLCAHPFMSNNPKIDAKQRFALCCGDKKSLRYVTGVTHSEVRGTPILTENPAEARLFSGAYLSGDRKQTGTCWDWALRFETRSEKQMREIIAAQKKGAGKKSKK